MYKYENDDRCAPSFEMRYTDFQKKCRCCNMRAPKFHMVIQKNKTFFCSEKCQNYYTAEMPYIRSVAEVLKSRDV